MLECYQDDVDMSQPVMFAWMLQKCKIHEHLGETILLSQLHNDLTDKLDISPNSISSLIFLESKDYTYVIIGVTLGAALAIGFVAVIICMMKVKMIDSDFGGSDGKMDRRNIPFKPCSQFYLGSVADQPDRFLRIFDTSVWMDSLNIPQ
ncbi:hypothetical protein TURU_149078 [Turdus rufiventris]|nr:hypothetical protein TURU_149078 [Turdus rufiventris]